MGGGSKTWRPVNCKAHMKKVLLQSAGQHKSQHNTVAEQRKELSAAGTDVVAAAAVPSARCLHSSFKKRKRRPEWLPNNTAWSNTSPYRTGREGFLS